MIYSNFKLQNQIWGKIQRRVEKKSIPNAFLFHGEEGVGKEGYSIELAGTLNCERRTVEACGKCNSCKKIISFQHGNVKLIIPYPRGKIASKDDPSIRALTDKDINELEKMRKLKGQNPFSNISLPKATTILINSIRELKNNIYLSSIDKGYTVILIFNAEKLCQPQAQSGNALLKLLEEPPNKTIFILVTSYVSSILPTIRSRCHEVFFPNVKLNDVINYKYGKKLSEEKMNLIANISNGNMKIATNLIDNVDSLFSNLKIVINCLFNPTSSNWQTFINKISNLKRTNKCEINYFFRTIILYFRDLMINQSLNENNKLIFLNLKEHYVKINTIHQDIDWKECVSITENTYKDIDRNGYAPLQSISLLIRIQNTLDKKLPPNN